MIIPLLIKMTDTVLINLCPGTDADEFSIGFRYVRLKRIFRGSAKKPKGHRKLQNGIDPFKIVIRTTI
jgi:hypothetical protein